MKLIKHGIFIAIAVLTSTTFAATTPRIDISGKNKVKFKDLNSIGETPLELLIPAWKWVKGPTYITTTPAKLKSDTWHKVGFSFTPENDGVVEVRLLTNPRKKGTHFDMIEISGAELKNGSFEQINDKTGMPLNWIKRDLKKDPKYPAMVVVDRFHNIKDGKYAVHCSHDSQMIQKIKVLKDQQVTLSAWVFMPTK